MRPDGHKHSLLPGADEFFWGFWEISTDRQLVSGFRRIIPGPLPSQSIDRWIDRNGLIEDEPLARDLMRAMDAEYQRSFSQEDQQISQRTLSPDLVTALFS
jgi:hypothetical protein